MQYYLTFILFTLLLAGFLYPTGSCGAEEYRILAIRVDFPYEEPDHETTSGRGRFDLRDYYTDPNVRHEYTHPWDIPPHNRQYFDHHLQALARYWEVVSEGRTTISYEIWPQEPEKAYTMGKKFYKYGNGRTKEQTSGKLLELFQEAVLKCKQTEGDRIDFSRFDTYMIIHAGIGSETSGMINDIPSAFLSPEDFSTFDSPLSIDGTTVDNGIIVPEMTSSFGSVGLNGIMAQIFGFKLGLPSLSNNKDGLPGAGSWCLMDTGAMAWGYRTLGFIPTHPCIWSKIELSWVEPVVVTSDTTLDIAATHIDNGLPRGVKIPINSDEYLLIENRFRYAPRDSLPESITFSDSDTSGVWIEVEHYDAFIPGRGILIWHANDRIIDAYREDNTINDDSYRRGLDLLEADGRQDIGALFSFGDERAEYVVGHEDDTFKLGGNSVLSPRTNPHSGSMWGGNSGITVNVLSNPGDVMRVSISFSGKMKGFPVSLGTQENITAADLDGDGSDEIIVSGNDSTYVITADGNLAGAVPSAGHPAVVYDPARKAYNLFAAHGSQCTIYRMTISDLLPDRAWELPVSADGKNSFFGATAVFETSDGAARLLASSRLTAEDGEALSSKLHVFSTDFLTETEMVLPDTTSRLSLAVTPGCLAAVDIESKRLYISEDAGSFTEETINAETVSEPILVDLNRDNSYETVITADQKLLLYDTEGSAETVFLPGSPIGSPVAADIDSDGYPEVVVAVADQVWAFRANGVRVGHFPFNLPPGDDSETITSSPLIADLDNDGRLDIAVATSNMRIVAFTRDGLLTPGFPLVTSGLTTVSPCVFRLSDTGDIALAYITVDGTIMAHDLMTEVTGDQHAWSMWKGGPGLTAAYLNEGITGEIPTTAPFEAFCYPNPITGNTGTFRIIPSGVTDCTITVYTADGRKVFEDHRRAGEIIPGVANEIKMDAHDLASGLYIAKIKTRQKTLIYKLGVLK